MLACSGLAADEGCGKTQDRPDPVLPTQPCGSCTGQELWIPVTRWQTTGPCHLGLPWGWLLARSGKGQRPSPDPFQCLC